MRRFLAGLAAVALIAATPAVSVGGRGVVAPRDFVDPMIGSFAPGFTNPGPVRPHGMVGLGPDTAEGPLNYGGYYITNSVVTGFSHTHMSAGVWQGGHVPLFPMHGEVDARRQAHPGSAPIPLYASPFDRAGEVAEAGYYSVILDRYGVIVELTATERTGMHRYEYPPGLVPKVVLDPSRSLRGLKDATIALHPDDAQLVVGTVHDDVSGPMDIHYAIRANEPFTLTDPAGNPVTSLDGQPTGVLEFEEGVDEILVKVGISYTDIEGAVRNLDTENPYWNFGGAVVAAASAWDEALDVIEVEGGTDLELTSFYTALYHAQLFPNLLSDVDGRYRGGDGQIHHSERPRYTQFSLWDSKNGQNALLAVIDPARYEDMLYSLADFAEKRGHLPRWQLGPNDPGYMSGDPVLPFIAEGVCRGLLDGEQHAELRERLLSEMLERYDARKPEYRDLGYLPVPQASDPVSVLEGGSRDAGTTLEYGFADLALGLVADRWGAAEDRDRILETATNYRNLLDPETGFIRPRDAAGAWLEHFYPENGYGFQEGTSWQYSWLAMQDLAGLVGGMADAGVDVEQRLDQFFGLPLTGTIPVAWPKVQNQATAFGIAYYGNQYAPGNEHDLEAPYVYNWVGVPWKTQAVARGVASLYTPTYDGLPGNDDLGALSGWLAWTMLGVFPITPGAPVYTVGSPTFERATIHRPDGDLVIEAPGANFAAKYVQSASLDGAPLDRTWFAESEVADGGTVSFELGVAPSEWGTSPDAAPPSLSTHDLAAFDCRT